MKLLRDYIDHEVLRLQNFRQQIRDNDPISLYKALDNQFLIATSTDFATVRANLDEHVNMKSGEYFTEFKARWDQVVLEWILLNKRRSVGNKNDKFIYPLKGEDHFKSKYPEIEPLVTDQWLAEKLINCFSSLRIDPKVKNRYDVILKIQLDKAQDDKANTACYLKLCEKFESEDKNCGDLIRQEREKHIQSLTNTTNVSIKEDTLNNYSKP
jgi:hypothetical protein